MIEPPQVIRVKAELGSVVVRPGDRLVIGVSRTLTQADAHEIKRQAAERLPGVDAVIISDCSGLAVYRDDGRPARDAYRDLGIISKAEHERRG